LGLQQVKLGPRGPRLQETSHETHLVWSYAALTEKLKSTAAWRISRIGALNPYG
jgi:hypothetical protein